MLKFGEVVMRACVGKTLDPYLTAAIDEARKGRDAGGIPIGSVLVIGDRIVARGHNQRVQRAAPCCMRKWTAWKMRAGCSAADYRRAALYSTLSPCDMCSGAILLYGIPKVVIGENRTFQGPEDYLRSRGVEIEVIDDATCRRLMEEFIAESPGLWHEDIGEP